MSKNDLVEAFKELDLLESQSFDVDKKGTSELEDFLEDDSLDDFEVVIDPEAETEEDLQKSYMGKAILMCDVCHSMIYKDPAEIVIDEESQLANVGELCPYCFTGDGYKVVGKVAPYEEVTVEAEKPVEVKVDGEEVEVEDKIEEEIQQDQKFPVEHKKAPVMEDTKPNKPLKEDWDDEDEEIGYCVLVNGGSPLIFSNKKDAIKKAKELTQDKFNAGKSIHIYKGNLNSESYPGWDDYDEFDGKWKEILKLEAPENFNLNSFDQYVKERSDYYGYEEEDIDPEDLAYEYLDDMSASGLLNIPDKYAEDPDNVDDDEAFAYFGDLIKKYNLVDRVKKLLKKYSLKESMDDNNVDTANEPAVKPAVIKIRVESSLGADGFTIIVEDTDGNIIDQHQFKYGYNVSYSQLGVDKYRPLVTDVIKKYLSRYNLNKDNIVVIKGRNVFKGTDVSDENIDYFKNHYLGSHLDESKNKPLKESMDDISITDDGDFSLENFDKYFKENFPRDYEGYEEEGLNSKELAFEYLLYMEANDLLKSIPAKYVKDPNNIDKNEFFNYINDLIKNYKLAGRVRKLGRELGYIMEQFDFRNKAERSLKESMDDISITTEDQVIKIKSTPREDKETIQPVTETEIEKAKEDEEDTSVEEEPEEVDVDLDEIDEEGMDDLGESYLKSVYENVSGFKASKAVLQGNKMILEGVISFTSGNKAKTKFIFESKEATKRGKLKFLGENKNISKNKKAFTLIGSLNNKKLMLESLNYNYTGKDSKTGKTKRLYGTIRRKLK